MTTSSFGQAAALLASAVTVTHGGFLHSTDTDAFFTSAGGQSVVAVATMFHVIDWPAVHCGIVVLSSHATCAAAATVWLKTCWPLTVTTMFSAATEQLVTVPKM